MIEAVESIAGPWASLAVALAVLIVAALGALALLAALSWAAAHEHRAHDWQRRGGARYGAELHPLTRCPSGLAAFAPSPHPSADESPPPGG